MLQTPPAGPCGPRPDGSVVAYSGPGGVFPGLGTARGWTIPRKAQGGQTSPVAGRTEGGTADRKEEPPPPKQPIYRAGEGAGASAEQPLGHSMKIAVIIPTFGRPDVLGRSLAHLDGQTRPPDIVVVSAPDASHVPASDVCNTPFTVVTGGVGLCAQRNRAMEHVLASSDVITFFDDDFLPADTYLERVARWFEQLDDLAAITGHAAVDGARTGSLSFDEGLMALRALEAGVPPVTEPYDQVGLYGCNMSIRCSMIGDTRFDERLVLYGWQEDIDFTARLRHRGRVIEVADMTGVHLGVRSGRTSGIRFGYSQIVNPTYLIRKGSMPSRFGWGLMARNVCANVARSVWPDPHVDRWGRLKGNVIGALHVARGRIEPEYILQL